MRKVFSAIALAGLIVCSDTGDADAQVFGRGGRGGPAVTISGAGVTFGQPNNGYYGNQGFNQFGNGYGNQGFNQFGNGYYGNQGYQSYNQNYNNRGFGNGYNSGYGYNSSLSYGNNRNYYAPAPAYNSTQYYTTPNATTYYSTPNNMTPTYSTPNNVIPAAYSTPLTGNSTPNQQVTPMVSNAQNRAYITVIVPTADAQVLFAGTKTTTTGTERLFNSPVLEAGQTYKYSIVARWTVDGKTKEQTREVEFRAGQNASVDFRSNQDENLDRTESNPTK